MARIVGSWQLADTSTWWRNNRKLVNYINQSECVGFLMHVLYRSVLVFSVVCLMGKRMCFVLSKNQECCCCPNVCQWNMLFKLGVSEVLYPVCRQWYCVVICYIKCSVVVIHNRLCVLCRKFCQRFDLAVCKVQTIRYERIIIIWSRC